MKKVIITKPVQVTISENEIVVVFDKGVIGVTSSASSFKPMVDKAIELKEKENVESLKVMNAQDVKEKAIN
jgi:hypothetical protein